MRCFKVAYKVCSKCREKNNPAFTECWRCKTPLEPAASNIQPPQYAGWMIIPAIVLVVIMLIKMPYLQKQVSDILSGKKPSFNINKFIPTATKPFFKSKKGPEQFQNRPQAGKQNQKIQPAPPLPPI
jgi:hypothetical protein